jgi:hypothetical protein
MNTQQKLVMALQNLRDDVADYVQEVGGCDHAVGVCMCRELEHLFQADSALDEAKEDSEETAILSGWAQADPHAEEE